MPTESYLYLSRQLANFMMRLNLHIGPIRTQMTSTQKMNNSEMSTKNNPNSHVYSLDENK